ncbi:DUF805 domain-containing protein [bacterium]|nr:DUF805 domain-containing protein [bacterium]
MQNALLSFDGRIGRVCFLVTNLIALVPAGFALLLIASGSAIAERNPHALTEGDRMLVLILSLIGLIIMLGVMWVAVAITVKRLHDINMSGWWTIPLLIIPFVAFFLLFVPGSVGRNAYGEEPGDGVFDVGAKLAPANVASA